MKFDATNLAHMPIILKGFFFGRTSLSAEMDVLVYKNINLEIDKPYFHISSPVSEIETNFASI